MRIACLIFMVVVLFASCASQSAGNQYVDTNIFGKWKYTEQYVSIGGPGQWKAAEPSGQMMEFRKNGKLITASGLFKGAKNFRFLDSARIQIYPLNSDARGAVVAFSISEENKLTLTPMGCIEGCGSRFIRQ